MEASTAIGVSFTGVIFGTTRLGGANDVGTVFAMKASGASFRTVHEFGGADGMAPTLAYAYATGDSITFMANTEGGPFGLSPATLLGMPNSLEMQNIIQRGMNKK